MPKMEQAMNKLTIQSEYEIPGLQSNICSSASNKLFKIVKSTSIESRCNNKINNNNSNNNNHNHKTKAIVHKNNARPSQTNKT